MLKRTLFLMAFPACVAGSLSLRAPRSEPALAPRHAAAPTTIRTTTTLATTLPPTTATLPASTTTLASPVTVETRRSVRVPAATPVPPTSTTAPSPPAPLGDYHLERDWPLWQCIGRHEQGLNAGEPDPWGDGIGWAGTPRGGRSSSRFPGGLGIARANWTAARARLGNPVWIPTNGADAAPAVQLVIAREHARVYRYSGWSTHRLCGV